MSFEKTETYTQKLEGIRRKSQDTEEEKYDKKEHAKEFRMEVMLDNACLMQNLTAQLEYNPWSTQENLVDSTKKIAEFLAYPEAAENFIDDLLSAKKRVESAIEKRAKETGKPIAEMIYRDQIQDHTQTFEYQVKGEITLDTSYPLAIILYIENSQDFRMIDTRTNIGGFYRASGISRNSITGEIFLYPLIVIRGSKKDKVESGSVVIEEHEKGHAEHQRLISTMKNMDIKNVWLKFREPPSGATDRLKILYDRSDSDKALGWKHSEKDWNIVMDYALERAKDELLAELKATGSIEFHLNNLLAKEGVYDYFKGLGIEPNSQLYNDLWKKYERTLRTVIRYVDHLLNSYKMFGLYQRMDLMRWVFAQIPLKDWENQITKSAFWDEANSLYDILNKPERVSIESHQEFLSRFRSNQSHSLSPLIKEYRSQLLN